MILALWLLAGTGTARAQNPCFASPGKSHIVQIRPLVAADSVAQLTSWHQNLKNVTYYDGLGRKVQEYGDTKLC